MSHAPTKMPNSLRPVIWRSLAVVGVVAVLMVAASIIPTHKADAAFHAGHAVAVTDCLVGGGSECGGYLMDRNCSSHSGCLSAGILPPGSSVIIAPGRDWAVADRAIVSGWADFPAKPPPISLL